MTYTLFYPVFGMFILTMAVTVYMAVGRMRAMRSGQVDPRYFKTYEGTVPEKLITVSRHFSNLFEIPVLFYAGAIIAIFMNIDGTWVHVWAWGFLAARVAHALIHLSSNKLRRRMGAYALSWVCLTGLWVVVAAEVIGRA